MARMSVAQAAEHFGVSKEAIHNRIRRGSLKSVIVDGTKYVQVENAKAIKKETVSSAPRRTNIASGTSGDERYYKLLEEQNTKLQIKVEKLEFETRTLREEKEQLLIEERNKIEDIYKQKDEQLKNILQAISAKFLPATQAEVDEHLDVEVHHVEHEETTVEDEKHELISLKKYLKKEEFSEKKQFKIKKRFEKKGDDPRVVKIGKKYYIDPNKYDYSDLLK